MEYLLSNGRSTKDTITYVKDLILLNMKLRKREIPYSDLGTDELIPDVITGNLKEHVKKIVSDVLSRIMSDIDNINLSVEDIIIDNSIIRVKINLNGNYIYYQTVIKKL